MLSKPGQWVALGQVVWHLSERLWQHRAGGWCSTSCGRRRQITSSAYKVRAGRCSAFFPSLMAKPFRFYSSAQNEHT